VARRRAARRACAAQALDVAPPRRLRPAPPRRGADLVRATGWRRPGEVSPGLSPAVRSGWWTRAHAVDVLGPAAVARELPLRDRLRAARRRPRATPERGHRSHGRARPGDARPPPPGGAPRR